MQFTSIRGYFYKLKNILYLIVLPPILLFALLHLHVSAHPIGPVSSMAYGAWIMATPILLALFGWALAFLRFQIKLKRLHKEKGFGLRLEKYADLTIGYMGLVSFSSLLLGLGLYLTHHDVFTLLFLLAIGLGFLKWPYSRNVSRELKLKGDEREMLLNKKNGL